MTLQQPQLHLESHYEYAKMIWEGIECETKGKILRPIGVFRVGFEFELKQRITIVVHKTGSIEVRIPNRGVANNFDDYRNAWMQFESGSISAINMNFHRYQSEVFGTWETTTSFEFVYPSPNLFHDLAACLRKYDIVIRADSMEPMLLDWVT